MRVLILAAGMGTRLRPLTDQMPKTLVQLNGKPLLHYQLETFAASGLTDIGIVTGYRAAAFKDYPLQQFYNSDYQHTNMLYSLMRARSWLDGTDDLIVSYGDICYCTEVLSTIIRSEAPITVSADAAWQQLWQLRMEDPLNDAESFLFDRQNLQILQLGQKMTNLNQAQAQYIGLFKLSKSVQLEIVQCYDELSEQQQMKMYMTDFLQLLIEKQFQLTAALHQNGWLEVDSVQDLETYQQLNHEQQQRLNLCWLADKK
ncbi:MAG: phosphocholine cytidylyltransferase family protein [Gammaproteobacteria bacterium]|nr:phosphocholine cytidylyltransferase family protein [Gammaproteobacteria bacterium]